MQNYQVTTYREKLSGLVERWNHYHPMVFMQLLVTVILATIRGCFPNKLSLTCAPHFGLLSGLLSPAQKQFRWVCRHRQIGRAEKLTDD
jgi:hypothetical protein